MKWSRKLRWSGYPATRRHEGIKAAYEKFDKMCEDEDEGVRPIHRPREWKKKERRVEKEAKVSAPLILDPTAGSLSKDAKEVCRKFEQVTGMRVVVQERAGNANKALAKSEPLKNEMWQAESQEPRQRVSVANRKVFARPESFCAVDI